MERLELDRSILLISGTLGTIIWIACIVYVFVAFRTCAKSLHNYIVLALWLILTGYAIYVINSGITPTRGTWMPVL